MEGSPFVLSFDVEEWFHSLDPDILSWQKYTRRIEEPVNSILDYLDQVECRAVFFILGDVALNNPDIVRKIFSRGHEIGSHGFNHEFIYKTTQEQFRNDLKRSLGILSDLTGDAVVSFRAPYFSITNKSLWAFDILAEEGIRIDSSIYPVLNHRYGIPDHCILPYKISDHLWEWPLTVKKTILGNFPFSGGVYFRFLPVYVTHYLIESALYRREPLIFYFHPWEFDPRHPRLNHVSQFLKFRHYYGLEKSFYKLKSILNGRKTTTMKDGVKMLGQML